ncbi:TraR/DksA C4-type zinc finger protein [Pseudomonas sp. W03]|uniref:TraR/DksA C4-type zinc finger protein n=1 Tax=Pseudomonas sp. W03 TaxID=3090666 RepID=UPI003A4D81C0
MADIADIANDNILLLNEVRLASRKPAEVQVAEECEDCGSEIPEARRLALIGRDCIRCIDCQTIHELRG